MCSSDLRSAALEQSDGTMDALRMSGLPPAALFIGKATAVFVQLVLLEVVLLGGLLVLYGVQVVDPALLVVAGLLAGVARRGVPWMWGMDRAPRP